MSRDISKNQTRHIANLFARGINIYKYLGRTVQKFTDDCEIVCGFIRREYSH